ncbi:MAG: hypothetical protein LBL04_17530, partial [Bacteroidales bacterium]|nr:hypothetical protein [Bacteroidales bacterium]
NAQYISDNLSITRIQTHQNKTAQHGRTTNRTIPNNPEKFLECPNAENRGNRPGQWKDTFTVFAVKI